MRHSCGFGIALLLAIVGVTACGDAPANDEGTTGVDADSSTGEPSCTPGYEGCPCADGVCLAGLSCFSDFCVMADDPDTASASSGSVDPDDGTTAMPGTEDAEGSSSDDAIGPEGTTDGESSDAESSTTAPPIECTPEETACADETYQTCVDGAWQDAACDDVCAATGYASSGCADDVSCLCDEPTDTNCQNGAAGYCFCVEEAGAGTCTEDDYVGFYEGCFDGTVPEIDCFGGYVMNGQIDCQAAIDGCL